MQHITFRSDLGDATPAGVDGYIKNCSIAGKIRVWTKLTLTGRGVELCRTLTPQDLVPQAQKFVGFNEYSITEKAAAKMPFTFAEDIALN